MFTLFEPASLIDYPTFKGLKMTDYLLPDSIPDFAFIPRAIGHKLL
jgi:hypothetical protein